jgi:adenine-specific DNA-methyltransferase
MPTLHWIGKEKVVSHHQDVPYRVLEHKYHFDAEKGETSGLPAEASAKAGNKIIHGDNLEALKSLLPEYEGKVKCIYIDPPYNTGEEKWAYNDNVNHPKIIKWLGEVVGKDGEDLTRHDKWLCMMYPRLKLLHKLLTDDGAIFISIDDNEQANLKLICDEIFGTSNFITNFIWEKRTNRENRKEISYRHDYILGYRRNKLTPESSIKLLPMSGEALERYKNPDNDTRGNWKSDPATAQSGHATKSQFYELTAPNGKKHKLQSGRCWVYNEDVMNEAIADNRIWFGKDGNGVPRIKTYLNSKERGLVPETLWFAADVGTNETAKVHLKSVFQGNSEFQTPKPFSLIERILQISSDKNSIILDSFAGSGTTAHAVLNLNKQDGGNRKFILVEMEDYANDITAERVKRVTKGYGTGNKKVEGTGGAFDFYELGLPLFDENQNLNEQVGLAKIREYIWFSETRTSYNDECRMLNDELGETIHNSTFITHNYKLGVKDGTVYYFIYEKNRLTTLDYDALELIKTKGEQYIIYADNCLLPKEFMAKKNIIFKKIPRDITRF